MALGEKRNGSVFATAAQRRDAAEYQVTSEPEVVPVVVDDTPQRTLNTDIGTLGRAHNLFFTGRGECLPQILCIPRCQRLPYLPRY